MKLLKLLGILRWADTKISTDTDTWKLIWTDTDIYRYQGFQLDGGSVSVNICIFCRGIGIGWTKKYSIGIGKNKTDPPSLISTDTDTWKLIWTDSDIYQYRYQGFQPIPILWHIWSLLGILPVERGEIIKVTIN